MNIRPAHESDIPSLAQMYVNMFNHINQNTGSTLNGMTNYATRKLNARNYWIFVAEEDGVIGTLATRRMSKNIAYICDAFVLPEYRRTGVMGKIEEHIQVFLRGQGFTRITLEVKKSNNEGVNTWTSLGFSSYEYQMEKKLD